jgi:hypothetical protein
VSDGDPDDPPVDGEAERTDRPDPFADLAADARASDDPFAELDEAPDDGETFESVEVSSVPIEEVWASIAEDADDVADEDLSVGGDAEAVGTGDHRVPKRQYCARCPHFAAPPAVACTHEGTSIVAVEDAEQFVVRNCPMVETGGPSSDS